MNFQDAESRIYELTKQLREEFDNSHYKVFIHPEAPEEGIMITISDCSIPESYKDHLLDIGDELKELLSFLNASTKTEKNKLTTFVINKLTIFNPFQWPIVNNLDFIPSKDEWEEITINKVQLFESAKKEAHTLIISDLKSLLTNAFVLDMPKIKWKGAQTDLADLIGNLIAKDWIENPQNKDPLKDLAAILNAVFDLSETTKTGSSDKTENLRKYLMPSSKWQNNYATPSGHFFEIKKRK